MRDLREPEWEEFSRLVEELTPLDRLERDERLARERQEHSDSAVPDLLELHFALDEAAGRAPGEDSLFRAPPQRKTVGASPRAGDRLGEYVLLEGVGRGGMGQVWRARDESLERDVAIKLLHPERLSSRGLDLFRREARAGARLHHPGIVSVLAAGEADGLAWIAMEFVEGAWSLRGLLDEIARRPELPAGYYEHAARFLAETAQAVHAAHAAGVIHRDLKPQNILITADEHPKVTDFGLARITDERSLSASGDIAGTYYYMSPEQVDPDGKRLDHRTDVFSLGVVLYEMLALRRPFDGDTTRQIAHQILDVDPPPLQRIRSLIPRDLAVICAKCLEKRPAQRYASALELAQDLERFLAGEPIHARPAKIGERATKWFRRHPVATTSMVAGATAFAIILALLVKNTQSAESLRAVNASLRSQREELGLVNAALAAAIEEARVKAREAEASAEEARRQERSVMRLAAFRTLEELTREAAELGPPHPRNIPHFEEWLDRAARLVALLEADPASGEPSLREQLAGLRQRALPRTEEELDAARRADPLWRKLQKDRAKLASWTVMQGVREGAPAPELPSLDDRDLPSRAGLLTDQAKALVLPNRVVFGREAEGLALALRAMDLSEDDEQLLEAGMTAAWGFLYLGREHEALSQVQDLVDLLAEDDRVPLFEQAIRETLAFLESPEWFRTLEDLDRQVERLERQIDLALPQQFDQSKDAWLHDQLRDLVARLEVFSSDSIGLMGSGISPTHGWGVRKRLQTARELERELGTEGRWGRAWARMLPLMQHSHPSLALEATMDLVPLGQDPESGLWEFAHLPSGVPPERGQDGQLAIGDESSIVFVLIPGSTFVMGATKELGGPNHDPHALPHEGKPHEVELASFFLSKYELTQGQWKRLTGANPSRYGRDGAWNHPLARDHPFPDYTHPVESLCWNDCARALEPFGLTLPTEAQWEYGARAGTSSPWWTGDEVASLQGAANVADAYAIRNGFPRDTAFTSELDDGAAVHLPVDTLRPNGFGLYHVHGNVQEWCLEPYVDYGWIAADPETLVETNLRVLRGGAFTDIPQLCRSSSRMPLPRETKADQFGVRPARALSPD